MRRKTSGVVTDRGGSELEFLVAAEVFDGARGGQSIELSLLLGAINSS